MDETLRRMGLEKTRARKGAVRPKVTGEDVRRMLADVATSGGVPFVDAASQAQQGNYGQAAISGLLDAPPVKMAGMALAPLIGMVKGSKAAPMDEALRIAQKNAAKPVSEGGLGLPKNNTPMERAKVMGFVGAYHGTADDVVKIDPTKFGSSTGAKSAQKAFWSVDDPMTARTYAEFAAKDSKVKKLLDAAEDAGNKGDWDRHDYLIVQAEKLESELIKNPLRGQNIMPLMVRANQGVRGTEMNAKGSEFIEIQDELNKFLTKASKDNRDLAIIRNLSDAPGRIDVPATHFAAINPSIVRSRFAAFDPARINENNLLASLAALGIGIPTLRGLLQEEEMQ